MRPSHCLTISILFALSLKVELKPLPFCAQERTLFIEKVDLKTHLLEMSSLDDRFAVVSSKKIHLHQATENGWKEIRSGVVPKMGKDPIAPIYFELLENNCVIICYDDGCNIGDFSEALTWKEYTFPPELSPATAVSVLYTKAGVLKVQVISSMNSAILIYGKDGKVIAQISDVDATTDLTTVLAFEDVGYAYFLGSVKRAYLPGIIAGRLPKTAPPKSVTRLTRIGNNDGTAELQLPIDLPLACGENKENLEEYIVLAATYDTRKKHIVAVIEKSDANGISKEYKVCLFQLADLQQDFKITLNVCQSTSRELSSQCKYGGEDIDNELSNLHCLIFTCRSGSRPSYTSCSACNNLPPGSGSLTKSNTTSHQYSRLVQFKPFVGVELVRLPSYGHQKPVSITLDGSSAVFVLYDDGLLFRAPLDERANSPTAIVSEPLWNASLPGADRQSITVTSSRLVYLNDTRVESIPLTCALLYQTCEMVMNKTDLEPLGCGWCSYSDGTGFSISKADNLAGGCVNKGSDGDVCTFFANTCPSFANDIPFVQQEFFTDEVVVVILSVLIYSGFAVLYVKLLDRHCRKLRSHRSYGPFKKEIIRRLQIELSELNSDAETENHTDQSTGGFTEGWNGNDPGFLMFLCVLLDIVCDIHSRRRRRTDARTSFNPVIILLPTLQQ